MEKPVPRALMFIILGAMFLMAFLTTIPAAAGARDGPMMAATKNEGGHGDVPLKDSKLLYKFPFVPVYWIPYPYYPVYSFPFAGFNFTVSGVEKIDPEGGNDHKVAVIPRVAAPP